MNYNLDFDYAAIGVMLFTLFFLISRKDMKSRDNRILLILFVMNLFSAIADIIAIRVQSDIPRFGLGPGKFWNTAYLFVHTQMTFVLLIYIITLLGIRNKLKPWVWVVLSLPSLVVFIVLALNPFLEWYFYYNEDNIYSYGPMTSVVFGGPFLQMLMILILIIRYRGVLPKNMLTALIVFLCAAIFAVLFQHTYREQLVELFVQSLGLLGFLLAVENKDDIRLLVEAMDNLEKEKQSAEEARHEAVLANRSKSDFLANMSHEIRTPINAVLGMNEMILREGQTALDSGDSASYKSAFENITSYAYNVDSAGKNLLSIINDILDLSKIEAGKMELTEAPYKLSSVLNDLSNMTTFRAESKNLAFHIDVDETIPDALYGDEVRIRQIVTNLLNNAVKYTKQGSVSLKVGMMSGLTPAAEKDAYRDKTTLTFSVTDTGIGIREQDLSRLFDKFQRVDLTRTNNIEGTGLGLAITYTLVDMMHGSIDVESTYGKGSAFTVVLPQGVMAKEPIGNFRDKYEKSVKEIETYHESFRAPGVRILAVDDTEMNLQVIEGLLQKTMVITEMATSGEQALTLAKDTKYDLILMDQRMPKMDGTKAMRAIRAQSDGMNRTTPVICLTADAVQGARKRYLDEGFDDYLPKPVEGAALEKILIQYIPKEKTFFAGKEDISSAPEVPATSHASAMPLRPTPAVTAPDIASDMKKFYGSIPDLHYTEAVKYLGTDTLIEKTLTQFAETLPARIKEIETYLADGDLENYTIKVHALKSSARTVGATGISKKAEELERLGNLATQET